MELSWRTGEVVWRQTPGRIARHNQVVKCFAVKGSERWTSAEAGDEREIKVKGSTCETGTTSLCFGKSSPTNANATNSDLPAISFRYSFVPKLCRSFKGCVATPIR